MIFMIRYQVAVDFVIDSPEHGEVITMEIYTGFAKGSLSQGL